jgi:hypothetical protein
MAQVWFRHKEQDLLLERLQAVKQQEGIPSKE